MKDTTKKKSGLRIVLIALGILLLLLLLAVGIVIFTLVHKYTTTSYETVETVEREDEYVMPEYPEVVIDHEGIWEEGVDNVFPPEVETVETPEAEVAETEVDIPETEAVETEEETEVAPEAPEVIDKAVEPAETLAAVVNTPSTGAAYTAPSNPNASFANSENAVSVYGKTPIYKVAQKDKNIINILAMGTDTRDVTADRGRSDTMIVFSYNKKTGSVKLTSLLRDSLIPIEGHGWNRINTAYFFGGVGLAINTVNQLYGLDIQNFVVIDFNGTKNFIDYIGGVDITLTPEEAELYSLYTGTTISPGLNHMGSELALMHMRNRTIGNDFGRTARQRDTLTAVIRQIASKNSVTELYDVIDYAFSLVKTNLSVTDLVSIGTSLLSNASSLQIESENVPFDDAYQFAWYNGMSIISYDIASAAARLNSFIYGD